MVAIVPPLVLLQSAVVGVDGTRIIQEKLPVSVVLVVVVAVGFQRLLALLALADKVVLVVTVALILPVVEVVLVESVLICRLLIKVVLVELA
jgi:hypothetical protein